MVQNTCAESNYAEEATRKNTRIMASHPHSAVILGASAIVWPYLNAALAARGLTGHCHSRHTPREQSAAFPWTPLDVTAPAGWRPPPHSTIISLLPLWLLPPLVPRLVHCRQLIAVGSTSVSTKEESSDPVERAVARRLHVAEAELRRFESASGVPVTLFRPTLIYGLGRDRNVSAIARFIRRWHFFPIARPGTGQRQPLHAADVAAAICSALDRPSAYGTTLILSGGEAIPYREMVERIFLSMGRPPSIVSIPPALPECLLRLVDQSHYRPTLFRRMNRHLAFSHSEATALLGFTPRAFFPERADLLTDD